MKELILYDLDGTLVDTGRDILNAANHMLERMEKPPLAGEEVKRFIGKGLHHLIKSCLKTEDLKQIEKGAKIYRSFYEKHMLDHSRLYPGAKEVLEYFRKKKQAVITNKPEPFSSRLLKALGIARYFIEIIAGDTAHPKKPNPQAILWLIRREGIEPSQTLLVGDSRIDIETASNAGIDIAVVSHGFGSEDELQCAKAAIVAANFKELLGRIRQKGW